MEEHHIYEAMGRDRHQRFLSEARDQTAGTRRPLRLVLIAQIARLLTLFYR